MAYTVADPPGGSTGLGAESDICDVLVFVLLVILLTEMFSSLAGCICCSATAVGGRNACHTSAPG